MSMPVRTRSFAAIALCLTLLVRTVSAGEPELLHVTATKSPQGSKVTIKIDGRLFAEYLTRSGAKPIVWPIIGPTGKPMTRGWPMRQKAAGEPADHVHHRSLWFTHGDVNGYDFWAEPPAGKDSPGSKFGTTAHREFLKIESGRVAVVATRNDWLDPKARKVCQDVRTLRFSGDENSRWIDFDITLQATEGPVTFGDTKEGTMGIRVAAPLAPDARRSARIVNSEGQVNGKAWGTQASWVDYSGRVDGDAVGICVMNHPRSFRYPTYWHDRTYGLCAANPFGWHDFRRDASSNGAYTIARGKSITLRYRFLFHTGDAEQEHLADAFKAYAADSK